MAGLGRCGPLRLSPCLYTLLNEPSCLDGVAPQKSTKPTHSLLVFHRIVFKLDTLRRGVGRDAFQALLTRLNVAVALLGRCYGDLRVRVWDKRQRGYCRVKNGTPADTVGFGVNSLPREYNRKQSSSLYTVFPFSLNTLTHTATYKHKLTCQTHSKRTTDFTCSCWCSAKVLASHRCDPSSIPGWWCSAKVLASHRCDPSSIPGWWRSAKVLAFHSWDPSSIPGWWRSAKVLASHRCDPSSIPGGWRSAKVLASHRCFPGSASLKYASHVRQLSPLKLLPVPGGFLSILGSFRPPTERFKTVL